MRWGCCGDHQRLRATVEAGYDYAEPPTRMLAPAEENIPADVENAFKACPITAEAFNVFVPGTLPVVGPDVDSEALRAHVSISAERAATLGAKTIVFGSGGARGIPDGFGRTTATDQMIAFLATVADLFEPRGITLAIEPLPRRSCNFIHTVTEAANVAREVGRPEIRILTDLSHAHANGDPFEDLATAADLLAHVHVPVPDVPDCSIGGSEVPHDELFRALRSVSYDRRISIEDHGKRFTDFPAQAAPVLRRLKTLWEEAV